ncbi:MAG: helix-turn-helix domain-containing protein [Turicibacter sp.]|nr:helix-turn-helix domain-containing protein [Turicibacter sp.]
MAKVEVQLRDKLLVTCAEAAAMLSTSEITLREIVKKGLIESHSIRGVLKFYVEDLHDYCNRMRGKDVDPYADVVVRDMRYKA